MQRNKMLRAVYHLMLLWILLNSATVDCCGLASTRRLHHRGLLYAKLAAAVCRRSTTVELRHSEKPHLARNYHDSGDCHFLCHLFSGAFSLLLPVLPIKTYLEKSNNRIPWTSDFLAQTMTECMSAGSGPRMPQSWEQGRRAHCKSPPESPSPWVDAAAAVSCALSLEIPGRAGPRK